MNREEPDTSGTKIPTFNDDSFDNHEWIQRGYELVHNCHSGCSAAPQGISIPSGKMLTKEGGKYTLVSETAVRVKG